MNEFNEKEFLEKVEKAASKGVSKGNFRNVLLSLLPILLAITLLGYFVVPKVNALANIFKVDESVEGHDLTLENFGILGYKAVDFQDAILGDSSKLKKIEVYRQEVSDATTTTDTGLFNLSVFSKNQIITYKGTAVYTVDLSGMKNSDIVLDEENRIVTIYIPHAKQEEINILEKDINYGDVEKGLLAIGDIKMTPEQLNEIQAGARAKMQEKLNEQKVLENADRFAKLSVWELYSPIIKNVSKNYSLEVEFKD